MDHNKAPQTAAEMSKMMFSIREQLSMWADVVEIRSGRTDPGLLDLIEQVDQYRAERGWSPHGFGGE